MLGKLFGDPSARKLKSFYNIIPDINILEDEVNPLTDEELRRKTSEFRLRFDKIENRKLSLCQLTLILSL